MDKFNERLTAAEFKKHNLRETLTRLQEHSSSLLVFSLQWKDLEAHYESLRNVLSQREKEARAQEQSLQCRLRCFEERFREFETKRTEVGILAESMKVLRKEFEVAECGFSERARLVFEEKGREIEEKVGVCESVRREIAERLVEIEERERLVERAFEEIDRKVEEKIKGLEELRNETEMREREIKCRSRELEKKDKELKELRRRLDEKRIEIECRDRKLEKKEKELEELRKRIKTREDKKCREYEEKAVKLEERVQEIERRDRESEVMYKVQIELLEIRKKEIEEKMENVRLDEERLKAQCEEIESRERKLDNRCKEIDAMKESLEELDEKLKSGERQLMENVKEVNLEEQRLKARLDMFELEKKEFNERFEKGIVWERRLFKEIEELKIREKKLNQDLEVAKNRLNIAALAMLRSEEPRKRRADNAADVVVQHCVVMDGRELQIFLNKLRGEHDMKRDMVFALLRFCSDPAKLVLDALVGFYPPHLKHGDHEFEARVVRNSCLLLLEQLMEMSPNIKPHVKGEAMKLSFDWITQMKVDAEHPMEVVAFLELVCAYGLADAFDENELSDYAKTVSHYRQIPKLSKALGLAGRIPG